MWPAIIVNVYRLSNLESQILEIVKDLVQAKLIFEDSIKRVRRLHCHKDFHLRSC